MKRISAIYLVLTMIFCIMPTNVWAGMGYTVTYNVQTEWESPVDTNSPYAAGDTVTVLATPEGLEDAMSGYTFKGWNTQADGLGTMYQPADTFIMPAEILYLYAIWEYQPTQDELDVQAAEDLIPSSITCNENNVGYNIYNYLNNISGMADLGVTLSITSSDPAIVSDGGITYLATEQTKSITVSASKNEVYGDGKTVNLVLQAYSDPTFTDGNGTVEDPYQITNISELNELRKFVTLEITEGMTPKEFVLLDDINLDVAPYNQGLGWEPIGNEGYGFFGNFNGNGHIISGLTINNSNGDYQGLFGLTMSNETVQTHISNVGIESVDIKGASYVGSLIGYNASIIKNCHSTGTITATDFSAESIGGLVGANEGSCGFIEESYSTTDITSNGAGYIGGLIGYNAGTVRDSYARGDVTDLREFNYTGGLIGQGTGDIINCYATGAVSSGGSNKGGIIGLFNDSVGGAITNCFYDSSTTGMSDTGYGTLKTTTEMKTQATYTGCDFTDDVGIWKIDIGTNDAYPYLRGAFTPFAITTNITASDSEPLFTAQSGTVTPVVVDSRITLTGTEKFTGAKVYITNGFVKTEDVLSCTNMHGITGSYDSNSGVLTLSGAAFSHDYQDILRTVTYSNTNGINANITSREIVFSVGNNFYFPATGHYYQFVTSPQITWTTAEAAAAGKTYNGLSGYLVTITSAEENQFVREKCPGDSWIGANDVTTEGTWNWVTGPEEGTTIGIGAGYIFATSIGIYSNWNSGEPNNGGGTEDYGGMYITENPGKWNDFNNNNTSLNGYLVEYGGLDGEEATANTEISKSVILQKYIPSTNANLSNLVLSAGTLDTTFSSDVTSYTLDVVSSVDSITITPTKAETHATITINDVAVTSGSTTNPITLTTGNNAITIVVTAESGATKTYTITVVRAESRGGGLGSSAPVIINGETENAGTQTTSTLNGSTVTRIIVDDKKIEEKLNEEGNNATIVIPVSKDSDIIVGQLTGQTVKEMEQKEAVLEIKTENVTYTLPAIEINIDDISSQIGQQVSLKDIKVNVQISQSPQDTIQIVEDTANKNNYHVVVKPVDFEITCTSGDKAIEVSKFNAYIERTVAIPDGIDPSKVTTGIVLNEDGTFSHVPTTIIIIDGKYFAKINSLTNSSYSVIYNPITFADMENHWAKESVNNMGSRLIITGRDKNTFDPQADISRAEFAAIIVRGLGLLRTGEGADSYKDVTTSDWYYDAVSIANEYGLIKGYEDGEFKPNNKITRAEAMAIIARAMNIVKLDTTVNADEVLAGFEDENEIKDWARKSIAACVKQGLAKGSNNKLLANQNITRAETAVLVERLLQTSELIDR